jgi:D-alanyl-D-alanine carboxypeptidase
MSSASDFFELAKYLYKSRKDILDITRVEKYTIASSTEHGYHVFSNIHPFVRDPQYIGGKTGHTDQAKDTMLTIFKIKNQPIAIIVLSSNNRKVDTQILKNHIEKMPTL